MKKPCLHHRRCARGFNLLELMAAITLFGILLAIGVPSMQRMSSSNAVAAQVNELVTALATARSEAATRGVRVSLCPTDQAQEECADPADANWASGWILFTDDAGGAGTIDAGDTVLQAWPPAKPGVVLTAATETITFLPSSAATATTFDIHKADCSGKELRRVAVDLVGRVSLSKQNCS